MTFWNRNKLQPYLEKNSSLDRISLGASSFPQMKYFYDLLFSDKLVKENQSIEILGYSF